GALGDLCARRRLFVTGMALFPAGSVVCALAPNTAVLIAGRGLAGLGAAFQLPGALSILNVTFPDADARAQAISVWGGFNGLAMAVGPTVGGLCVAYLGWQSVFWLVVPFGVVAIALAQWAVAESSDRRDAVSIRRGKFSPCFASGRWRLPSSRRRCCIGRRRGSSPAWCCAS